MKRNERSVTEKKKGKRKDRKRKKTVRKESKKLGKETIEKRKKGNMECSSDEDEAEIPYMDSSDGEEEPVSSHKMCAGDVCAACGSEESSDQWVTCEICDRLFHLTCSGDKELQSPGYKIQKYQYIWAIG